MTCITNKYRPFNNVAIFTRRFTNHVYFPQIVITLMGPLQKSCNDPLMLPIPSSAAKV